MHEAQQCWWRGHCKQNAHCSSKNHKNNSRSKQYCTYNREVVSTSTAIAFRVDCADMRCLVRKEMFFIRLLSSSKLKSKIQLGKLQIQKFPGYKINVKTIPHPERFQNQYVEIEVINWKDEQLTCKAGSFKWWPRYNKTGLRIYSTSSSTILTTHPNIIYGAENISSHIETELIVFRLFNDSYTASSEPI